jgi:hypothetical protein
MDASDTSPLETAAEQSAEPSSAPSEATINSPA